MSIEEFRRLASECRDDSNADHLCIHRLRAAAKEYGRDGEIAKNLLDQVCALLDLYPDSDGGLA